MARSALIIEDDADIAESVRYNLENAGFKTSVAATGESGLSMALDPQNPPGVILLDLMLPGMSGVEICRRLRRDQKTRRTPIIMLTAKAAESDRVAGLDVGADDYIGKPFSVKELLARVRAVLRRSATIEERGPVGYQGSHLNADFEAVAVAVDGAPIRLTRREFELLRYLVQNRNRVISRDRLLERVWGYDRLVETRSVDVHVGRLRNKLGSAGRQIETVVGLGYRFVE